MKVAIAGVWHVHAKDYTARAKALGEVVGVYDENSKWKSDFAAKHEIPSFDSYEALLASDAEAVIVCTSTDRHPQYIIKAAQAGKDIFTEKVLALDEAGCEAICRAIRESGVRFTISYPWKFTPGIMAVKAAVDEGRIGRVNYLRFRNCHNGSTGHWLPAHFYNEAECGGGAMIDLGAHGMYLTHWFLGEPAKYASTFNHFCRDEKDAALNPSGLEDNAITVMSYADGAIAVNETGFVSVGSAATLEVGGESGYLRYDGQSVTLRDKSTVTTLPLPEAKDKPIDAFLKGITPSGCTLEDACALTRMMIGAYAK